MGTENLKRDNLVQPKENHSYISNASNSMTKPPRNKNFDRGIKKKKNSENKNGYVSKSYSNTYKYNSPNKFHSKAEELWTISVDISNVISVQKNIQKFKISPFDTIGDLKYMLYYKIGFDVESQRILSGHIELKNKMRIFELDNGGSAYESNDFVSMEEIKLPLLKFTIKKVAGSDLEYSLIQFYKKPPKSYRLMEAMKKCQIGFARKFKPELAEASSGGTYFLKDGNKKSIACFKPADEEPMTPNNPRDFLVGDMGSLGLRQGVLSGEGCYREVAAFVIDEIDRFHGVPPCTLVQAFSSGFNNNSSNLTMTSKLGLHDRWKVQIP